MFKIKKKRNKKMPNSDLRVGEIVELISPFGIPPRGIYRIDEVSRDFIHYSVGELCGGVHRDFVEVIRRQITEPVDWAKEEIRFLEASVALCDCEECRSALANKQAESERTLH